MEMFDAFIIVLFVYWIAPTIIGFCLFRRRFDHNVLAFTFDDGPDPEYTPQLLDLLKKFRIKATFFVLGSKAKANPHLLHRIHEDGHLIGIHNYRHKSNWLMTPCKVRQQVNESADIVEQIIGIRPVYYRPPWGLLTLFDFFLHKKFQIVLWSIMAWDWREKGGSEKIKKKLLKGIQKGGVILLHDSGQTLGANQGAPLHTIRALEGLFTEGRLRDYACIRMDGLAEEKKSESIPVIGTRRHF